MRGVPDDVTVSVTFDNGMAVLNGLLRSPLFDDLVRRIFGDFLNPQHADKIVDTVRIMVVADPLRTGEDLPSGAQVRAVLETLTLLAGDLDVNEPYAGMTIT